MNPHGPNAGMLRLQDDKGSSLLADAFNMHWVNALNFQHQGHNVKYFAMLHADIVPDDWWLDTLIEDLETSQADLVSALVAIKDPRGLSSTAIDDPNDEWAVLRRLTINEAQNLPPVFSSADCGYPNNMLLANTGCWICRMDRQWRYLVHFEIKNKIGYSTKDKCWVKHVMPEDWNFSRQIGRMGGKVLCTRRVGTTHVGEMPYSSRQAWGEWNHDLGLEHKFDAKPINDGLKVVSIPTDSRGLPVDPDPPIPVRLSSFNGSVRPTNGDNHIPAPGVKGGYIRERLTSTEFPDVRGWLTDDEGRALANLAKGKWVLEIGSYCGRSTIWMARQAVRVVAVDTFDGLAVGGKDAGEYHAEFRANIERHNVDSRIDTFVGRSVDIVPTFAAGSFDLVFIDGSHDLESVMTDIVLARRVLKPDGLLVFHDYRNGIDVDVTKAVDVLLDEEGSQLITTVDSLAIVVPAPRKHYQEREEACLRRT